MGINKSLWNPLLFIILISLITRLGFATTETFSNTGNNNSINGLNAVYSSARLTSSTLYNNLLRIGQDDTYTVWRIYLKFNTSLIPDDATIDNATLQLTVKTDLSTTDFDVKIAHYNWSPSDPLTDGNKETAFDGCLNEASNSNYLWKSTNGISVNTGYNSTTLNLSNIDKTGITYLCILSHEDIINSQPTANDERIEFYEGHDTTAAYRPKLFVAYTEFGSGTPDLTLNSAQINFSNNNPIEGTTITISALINNTGNGNTTNVTVQFLNNGMEINNATLNISTSSSALANISWAAKLGPNNITVAIDPQNNIVETNENNNNATTTVSVDSSHVYYGKTAGTIKLGSGQKPLKDFGDANIMNIIITDIDATINFNNLQAISIKNDSTASSNDFTEIDIVLNMSNFNDSINNIYSTNGSAPKYNTLFSVQHRGISTVPITNSTNSSTFVTGILWDTSDDTNGEFDSIENEDLVFITKNTASTPGKYGVYDYELRIPVLLQKQKGTQDSIAFYLDLR